MAENSANANESEVMQKIRDVSENERFELAIRKLDFCRLNSEFAGSGNLNEILPICVDFLGEIIEYFDTTKENICEQIYPSLFEIVSRKIFGDLNSSMDNEMHWQAENEEKLAEESPDGQEGQGSAKSGTEEWHSLEWRHSKLVYELFFLVLQSDKFRATKAKDFVDQPFVRRLITILATCPDNKQRHCLAQILRRIYVKFVRFRPHIRKHLLYSLEEAVFDKGSQLATTKQFHGIAEMLDILENVISGFKVPLKSEEQQMFSKVLLPLHKIDSLETFYKELIVRVLQFVELDPQLAPAAIDKMLKWWPKTSGRKECIFLEELEVILPKVEDQRILGGMVGRLFAQVAKCISSQNFQVSVKALHFCKNERILRLIEKNSAQFTRITAGPMEEAKTHWSTKIQAEAIDFQNILMETNWKAYNKRKIAKD